MYTMCLLIGRKRMTVKPITPQSLKTGGNVPDVVIETVNEMLTKEYARTSSHHITLSQDDIVKLICQKTGVDRHMIFDEGWLNFEDIFRAAGWCVSYDKPAYNESYAATFNFKKA